jgi:hypothetical protein
MENTVVTSLGGPILILCDLIFQSACSHWVGDGSNSIGFVKINALSNSVGLSILKIDPSMSISVGFLINGVFNSVGLSIFKVIFLMSASVTRKYFGLSSFVLIV